MRTLLLFLMLLANWVANAQEKDRFKFAQTYVGLGNTVLYSSHNEVYTSQRITFGGLHFWSKADFYVSFPVANQNFGNKINFTEGILTGGRWLPFGLKSNGFRPYLGAHWQVPFMWGDNMPDLEKNAFSIESGFYYTFKNSWTVEFGARINPLNKWQVPYREETLYSSLWAFDVGIKKHFDFTAGTDKEWANKQASEMSKNGHKNTFGFGVGMSSVIALAPVKYLEEAEFFPSIAKVGIMPEFGLSYYVAKPDMVVRLAFRPTTRFVRNDDFAYLLKDNRLSVEAFKFLFDYQGFMPFVGIGITNSIYNLSINSRFTESIAEKGNSQSVSLVFGWDVRPTQAEWFILRTCLRYQPQKGFGSYAQEKFSRDLEFNFIQMVVYLQRIKYHFK